MNSLENEYRLLSLDKNRITDPELITKPNLLDKPIAPKKRDIVSLSFFLEYYLGLVSVFYDKSKNIIYSEEDIETLMSYPIIADFREAKDSNSFIDQIDLLIKGQMNSIKQNFL